MNTKRIVGIVAVIVGIVLICISNYIKGKLGDAEGEISSAKSKVKQGNELFSLNPVAEEIGKGITSGADRKIREAEGEVAYYYGIAKVCQYGGIGLIIVGGLLFIFGKGKKRRG